MNEERVSSKVARYVEAWDDAKERARRSVAEDASSDFHYAVVAGDDVVVLLHEVAEHLLQQENRVGELRRELEFALSPARRVRT